MRARGGRETGAAAVEFALLFPIFAMVAVGAITFGFAFASWINVTQAARETSRYAATLPFGAIPPLMDATDSAPWLDHMGGLAAANAGIDLATAEEDTYYICVRFVNETGGEPASAIKTWGTLGTPPTPGTCTGSVLLDNRVEVAILKPAPVSWVLGFADLTVGGHNTSRYEPQLVPTP